jgi:AAA+ superfamily predicted ATPase
METNRPDFNELFDAVVEYPEPDYRDRFTMLVGLDDQKKRLIKILSLLVNPTGISGWIKSHHPSAKKIVDIVLRRPPLVVLAGDVGSGKTELAMTVGDAVARQEKISVTLFPLSLSTRGEGRVGQMTKLISSAFDYTIEKARAFNHVGKTKNAVILLVDEADALAQSRESSQMHHEDRAGVNAFIRGVDSLGNGKLPAAVIMCTNRAGALDPAIKRRAADILTFDRPNENQRLEVLREPLSELGIKEAEILEVAKLTGIINGNEYGFTYSDLMQRLIPTIVLDAYPDRAVKQKRILELLHSIKPTPPFKEKLQ